MVDEMHRRSCHESPTRHFVHKLIDWERVNQRLGRYPAIRKAFSMKVLRAAEESPPYYCHYMAWRLGTWSAESEGCLANLDKLLASAYGGIEVLDCKLVWPDYSFSKPWLVNFSVRLFSVTVRTT